MRDVVDEIDAEFVLPLEGFCCAGSEDGVETPDGFAHVDLFLHDAGFENRACARLPSEFRGLVLSLVARRASVHSALATADSELRLSFDEGDAIAVGPDPNYEAWEVTGPGQVKVVAMPGGGEPAIWDATSETRTIRSGDPLPPDLAKAIESFGVPTPTGEFEFRRTKGRTKSFELGPPRHDEEE